MRIPSGVTDQYIFFVAVDATDFATRETGLTGFTVYRSRDGAAAVAMTTPTVAEVDATNMPGVYRLLLDEDMSIGAGNDSEEIAYHITVAGMAPVTRTIELYRPKITVGNTLGIAADGDISGNVDGNVVGSVASVTAAITLPTIPTNWLTAAGIAATALNGKGDWNTGKTGYSISGTKTTLDALNDIAATEIVSAGAITTLAGAVVSVTTNADMRGTDSANTTVPPTAIAIRSEMDLNSTQLAAIVADTNELQTDNVPGLIGALNDVAATDIVSAGAITTLAGAVVSVTTNADMRGTDGANTTTPPTAVQNRTEMDLNSTQLAAIVADTNELQTDNVPGLIATVQADTNDLQTRVPAALVGGRIDSNVSAIDNSAEAATDLAASAKTIVVGAAATGTLSVTQMTTNLTEVTNDHYNGRIIIWTNGVLKDQATNITAYTGTGGLLTFTGVTEAPSNGDTFVIV